MGSGTTFEMRLTFPSVYYTQHVGRNGRRYGRERVVVLVIIAVIFLCNVPPWADKMVTILRCELTRDAVRL